MSRGWLYDKKAAPTKPGFWTVTMKDNTTRCAPTLKSSHTLRFPLSFSRTNYYQQKPDWSTSYCFSYQHSKHSSIGLPWPIHLKVYLQAINFSDPKVCRINPIWPIESPYKSTAVGSNGYLQSASNPKDNLHLLDRTGNHESPNLSNYSPMKLPRLNFSRTSFPIFPLTRQHLPTPDLNKFRKFLQASMQIASSHWTRYVLCPIFCTHSLDYSSFIGFYFHGIAYASGRSASNLLTLFSADKDHLVRWSFPKLIHLGSGESLTQITSNHTRFAPIKTQPLNDHEPFVNLEFRPYSIKMRPSI